MASLKVKITDKISKLMGVFLFSMPKCYVVGRGKIFSKEMLEMSFLDLKVVDGYKFCIVCPDKKKEYVMKKWVRFGRIVTNDYFCMETSRWDAVVFIP